MDTTKSYSYVASSSGLDTVTLVTDTTTCSDTSFTSFNVLKDPKLINDTSVCLNDIIFVTAPPGWNKYKWSTGQTGTQVISRKTGTYAVTVSSHSGCEKSDSVKITHLGPELSLGADTFFCKGSSVDIQVGSNWKSVRWNYTASDTNRTKTIDSAGIYVAEVLNSIGCKFSDAIKVSEVDTILRVMGSDSVCFGNTVNLYVAAGDSNLNWSNGKTSDTITVSQSGTYMATAINSSGCKTTGFGQVKIYDKTSPKLGKDTSICIGKSFTLNPGTFKKYKWIFGSTANQYIVNAAGTYWVEVEDQNGCLGFDTIQVAAIKCDTTVEDTTTKDTTVFVPYISSKKEILIYPNPANDFIYVDLLNNKELTSGFIVDLNGRRVGNIELKESSINKIDVSQISSGTYLLILHFDDGNEVRKKLIIE
jgi:hypothetical protein